jgi:ABC-type Fe3+/spermidine/putrescine transport system ATPase subunit
MIELQEVTKSYGGVKAIDNISLQIPLGSRVVVEGPTGSGKTTLLRLIAGLEMPDTGEIRIGGELVSRPGNLVSPSRRGLGFVFQAPALWPHMTIGRNVLFGLRKYKKEEARARLEEVLRLTSLSGLECRYPAELSGGQLRCAALARTLATQPPRLLLDEPLAHTDPVLKEKLLTLINEITIAQGMTLIYVTHSAEEGERISSNKIRIENGRVVAVDGVSVKK